MKRFKILIALFALALAIPLAYLVVRSQASLRQEEVAQLRFFAQALFDQMEQDLADLVDAEEHRPVDDPVYSRERDRSDSDSNGRSTRSFPGFIIGYLQNNPDGSFQGVSSRGQLGTPADESDRDLAAANLTLNLERATPPEPEKSFQKGNEAPVEGIRQESPKRAKEEIKNKSQGFADRYLSPRKEKKSYLGKDRPRVEQITAQQAQNLAPAPTLESEAPEKADSDVGSGSSLVSVGEDRALPARPEPIQEPALGLDRNIFQVEINPLQSVPIDATRVFLFRRIVLGNQVFRQGFLLDVPAFLKYLTTSFFSGQPLARFTRLELDYIHEGRVRARVEAGAEVLHSSLSLDRTFTRPFSFLKARLTSEAPPPSPGRHTLVIMTVVLAGILVLGFLALYQSARVVVDLSERRAKFVSSVTHELKTPLTNIRMYVEMLEQGIAPSPEREQEYFRILESESARLSRLITNVLEFSKLEKKQRPLSLKEGDFSEVIREVRDVMGEALRQEGFTFYAENHVDRPFRYDSEVMVQVLVNLIENSMKFGKDQPDRRIFLWVGPERNRMLIRISDTGPGIPSSDLKKVFNDFFRCGTALTQPTKGTGIGLALVRKFVTAMGGLVWASNNPHGGCTLTISLPRKPAVSSSDSGNERA